MMSETKPSKRYLPDLKVEDYKKNPELVKRFVDNALESYETVITENEALIEEKEKIEHAYMLVIKENATLKERVQYMVTATTYQIFLGVFGGILGTFGVGIIFSSPDHSNPLGWILSFFGIVISITPVIYARYISQKLQSDELQHDELLGDDE